MPKKRYHRDPYNSDHTLASVAQETATSLAGDSPVLGIFKNAARTLTTRQDRHERLVKWSRDINVESKRIIFLLHSSITTDSLENTLTEARQRIRKLINEPIKSIGLELENGPAHLHSRAVTAGFQEYVEARTLLSFMTEKRIITYEEVQKEFEYSITEGDQQRVVVTMLPESDYILGLADLTGELMRKVINGISSGDIEECSQACDVIKHMYTGFLGFQTMRSGFKNGSQLFVNNQMNQNERHQKAVEFVAITNATDRYTSNKGITADRFLQRKLQTMRVNVIKVEMAMYSLRIRGREALPKQLGPAAPVWEEPRAPADPGDEGYYQEDCT